VGPITAEHRRGKRARGQSETVTRKEDDFQRKLTPAQRSVRRWGIAHPLQMALVCGIVVGLYAWRVFDDVRPGLAFGLFGVALIYLMKRRERPLAPSAATGSEQNRLRLRVTDSMMHSWRVIGELGPCWSSSSGSASNRPPPGM
jgi:hypothetical protein